MADPKDRQALDRLHDAIEASIEAASDAELREDLAMEGRNPADVAASMRSVFDRVGKAYRQKRLHEARRAREVALSAYEQHKAKLPTAPQARRTLLQSVIAAQPHLTMQFRDLDHQSDADVESLQPMGATTRTCSRKPTILRSKATGDGRRACRRESGAGARCRGDLENVRRH